MQTKPETEFEFPLYLSVTKRNCESRPASPPTWAFHYLSLRLPEPRFRWAPALITALNEYSRCAYELCYRQCSRSCPCVIPALIKWHRHRFTWEKWRDSTAETCCRAISHWGGRKGRVERKRNPQRKRKRMRCKRNERGTRLKGKLVPSYSVFVSVFACPFFISWEVPGAGRVGGWHCWRLLKLYWVLRILSDTSWRWRVVTEVSYSYLEKKIGLRFVSHVLGNGIVSVHQIWECRFYVQYGVAVRFTLSNDAPSWKEKAGPGTSLNAHYPSIAIKWLTCSLTTVQNGGVRTRTVVKKCEAGTKWGILHHAYLVKEG